MRESSSLLPGLAHTCLLAMVAALASSPFDAAAQAYPVKPIQLVVPVSAGSASDVRARQIAERLAKALGQPVIVDNRPGAGMTIGATYVARAKPDGYTLLYGTISDQALAPALYPDLPYDPRTAFIPVVQNSLVPPILVVNPQLGVNSMKELIALAKAKPDQITFGSWGAGTLTHLLGLQLAREAGIRIVHIPYKNATASLNDVMAGHVAMMFDYPLTSKPMADAGKLKILMTVGPRRSTILPQVPSAAELGMPAIQHQGWSVIAVPAKTPRDIVTRLNAELVRILRSPEMIQVIIESGGESDVVGGTPETIAAFIRREQESVAALIRATGMRLD